MWRLNSWPSTARRTSVDKLVERHLQRLEATVLKKHTAETIFRWITEHTKSGLDPFTYKDHEFQEFIVRDTSQEKNVQKCSQVGVSEISIREALALVNVIQPYTVAYTLPTAKFASTFMNTRAQIVINGSDEMLQNLQKTNDNTEVKQFGESFLYLKGAATSNAPISIPVDQNIHDELDFSDQEVIGQYQSRLTHSKWKKVTRFSTPTLPGFGINKAFMESRRHYYKVKCCHCNHWFIPSYYDHLRIPGYSKDLREINKQTLTYIRYKEAAIHCPKCDKIPLLGPEHRDMVCENPTENYIGAGYQVSPFDAPNIIVPSYLVEASTKYERRQDFDNFNLGLPADDSQATLMRSDFENIFVQTELGTGLVFVMGVDCGNTYHFQIDAIDPWDNVFTAHYEQVSMGKARERYGQLKDLFRPLCSVIDSAPHAETVMALQAMDPNLYAAVYTNNKGVLTYNVVERDQKDDEGREFVRQVNINRSRAFDAYMEHLRSGKRTIRIINDELKETYIKHHISMKRVKVYNNESEELNYSWQKSDGEDHFHHAGLYAQIAGKIRGVGQSSVVLPLGMVHVFKRKHA